jgi:hypothetical protein
MSLDCSYYIYYSYLLYKIIVKKCQKDNDRINLQASLTPVDPLPIVKSKTVLPSLE